MASGGVSNLAMGEDPRFAAALDEKHDPAEGTQLSAQTSVRMRAIRDPSVTFEEYNYYARQARAEEDATAAQEPKVGLMGLIFPTKKTQEVQPSAIGDHGMPNEKDPPEYRSRTNSTASRKYDISDSEWINAQRAVRQASGAAAFYLITTDILGPFALPYAFGTVGWAPGVVLFTIFAVLAGYSGFLLNRMFLGTDSYIYPARSYGDVGYRIYGQWGRIPINILQSLQLILNVSLITITNGQALSVIVKFKLCYAVCIVILVVAGCAVGQIRTLQKFGWLANVAVFMNVFIMIFTMAVAAHSTPNYGSASFLSSGASLDNGSVSANKAGNYPPVIHYNGLPSSPNFYGAVNGIMSCVFAYGGANVFNEFMAEMKRPRDFLHAMWSAQFFIWFVYMFYGLFMYGYQGQYSVNPSPQSISPYWALVIANLFYILSAGIAAALYGNIGLKVIYNNIGVELFNAPLLVSKAGKILWIVLIPLYWIVAFVIGAAIPNFNALVGIVSALCIVQFTYSFPPLLYIGYTININARLEGEGYDPATGTVTQHDKGFRRVMRGITGGSLLGKLLMGWNVIYFLGALALAALGMYASIEIIILTFSAGKVNSYSCTSPLAGDFHL